MRLNTLDNAGVFVWDANKNSVAANYLCSSGVDVRGDLNRVLDNESWVPLEPQHCQTGTWSASLVISGMANRVQRNRVFSDIRLENAEQTVLDGNAVGYGQVRIGIG